MKLMIVLISVLIVTIINSLLIRKRIKKMKGSDDPEQYLMIARHYHEEEKYKKALEWYEKAAQGGQAEAFYELSLYYENDIAKTGQTDIVKAFRCCLEAAKGGVENAQYKVACYFENGIGTNIDRDQALYWFKESMKNGNKLAASKVKKNERRGIINAIN